MSNRRTSQFAAGVMAALCGLAAPARAQYPYPYPAPPPVIAPVPVEPYPYLLGNQRFCWYDSAWNGPGWYWCGYAFRRGYGWGGAIGWNGWRWDAARYGRGGRGGPGRGWGEHERR